MVLYQHHGKRHDAAVCTSRCAQARLCTHGDVTQGCDAALCTSGLYTCLCRESCEACIWFGFVCGSCHMGIVLNVYKHSAMIIHHLGD